MKIYDISQEVFNCTVFPGDPSPERIRMLDKRKGDVCNLTGIKMCAHNGTHVDAPYHFINDGKKSDEISLHKFIGYAYVSSHEGAITAEDAEDIISAAKRADEASWLEGRESYRRILVKGKAVMTEEAARVFVDNEIFLFGNESQTVGPEDAPEAVHMIMLGSEVVLLEGIRLSAVEDGVYFLNAAPLNLGKADGSPCRAVLMTL